MAKIKIDTEALKQNETSLENKISELQEIIARLDNLIERINDSWEGGASELFIAKIRAQAAKTKKMIDLLTEYKKYVTETISKFSTIDNDSASKINNSF